MCPVYSKVEVIVAFDNNGGIGFNNIIPWKCRDDMKHFKEVTSGHVVIMGRKTWSSLPDKFKDLVYFGANMYIAVFKQLEYAMIDISYSDGGLSITIDRVGKLGAAIQNMEKMWLRRIQNMKYCQLLNSGGKGLGTPRYASNLSRFIGMLGNGAYGWNIP
jgi:hypothetical protein